MDRKVSIAPMMGYTDKHFRRFARILTKSTYLYTEMITANAIIYGNREHLLGFDSVEHPVACQLGGGSPNDLALAAAIVEDWGYDEINLNLGCPSPRAQAGQFGACLMKVPKRVAECLLAMKSKVSIPVTVKTRIGVDNQDSEDSLYQFIELLYKAGCQTFILHARKAWLKGLSPKENRHIPLLNYDRVYQLKRYFPKSEIIINGGITFSSDIERHLRYVDGVMLGRAAYADPYLMSTFDSLFYESSEPVKSRYEVLSSYLPYVAEQYEKGISLFLLLRHLMGLLKGMPSAKNWRRYLSKISNSFNFCEKEILHFVQSI